ncbi:MAG: peptidase S16 [Dehalococcoidia bacterium]|nr:peptidase S16 [Dehalococcoidia bacterium]
MKLRLFPLARVVLFPGMPLSLQVFEERYRTLVAECIEAREPFGVVLIREGSEVGGPAVPHGIGCAARLTSVIGGPSGMLHVTAIGERRFRIVALHDDRPYLSADVEFPVDEVAVVPSALIEQARAGLQQLERLRATAEGGYVHEPNAPEAPGPLADRIAALALAAADDRQPLLEQLDAGRRLEVALPLLERAIIDQHAIASTVAAARWAGFGAAN